MTEAALPGVIAKPIAILTDDLHLTYANAQFADLFATTALQLEALGRAVRAHVDLQRAFQHVLPRVAIVGRTASFRWTTDAAPPTTFQVHLARLPDTGILAILDEISDVVLAEDIQSGARAYLEEVINHLDRAVLVVDASLRVTFMNVAQRELLARLGSTTPWLDFVGQGVHEAYPVLGAAAWRDLCADVVTCGTVSDRHRVELADGDATVRLDIRALPLGLRAGDTGGAVILTEDVTRVVALEAAVNARERHAWMAHVALSLHHDINNPLTTVLGAAETLYRDPSLGTSSLVRVDAIRTAALKIAGVVRRLAVQAVPGGHDDGLDHETGRSPGPQPDR